MDQEVVTMRQEEKSSVCLSRGRNNDQTGRMLLSGQERQG